MTEVIGRDRELQALEGFLRAVGEGPSVAILAGDPGIGKTTLWTAAVRAAAARDCEVLTAAPGETESTLPYAVLGDLLGSLPASRFVPLPPAQRQALDSALLRGDPQGPPAVQRAVGAAVLSLLTAICAEGAVLIAIDDEQWIDSPSSAVLRFLVRRLESEPLALLLTHRTEREGLLVREAMRLWPDRRQTLVDVRPLDLEAIDNLLFAHLGRSFPRPVLDRLHAVCGGNPFFALEIGRFLVRNQGLASRATLPIPNSLKDLVAKRLARLPSRARQALLAVAALSQPTVEVVASVSQTEAADLEPAIADNILAAQGFRLRFSHPLIGSVVYETATPDERRNVHRRIAAVVADDERARHLALAATGSDATVAQALDMAARAANRRGAPDAAAMLAEQAAELTPLDLAGDQCRRIIAAADYHLLSGDTARAQELLQGLGSPDTPAIWRAPVLERQAKSEFYNGNLATAESLCREALVLAAEDPDLTATLHRDIITILHQQGLAEESLPHIHALIALAERLHDPALLAHGRGLRAFTDMVLGRGLSPEARDLAVRISAAVGPGRSDRNASILDPGLDTGVVLKWADDFAAARAVFKAVLRRMAVDHEESARAPVLFHLGEMEVWSGDWLLAAVYAEECRKAVLHSGQGAYRRLWLTLVGYLAACQGQLEQARDAAGEALTQARLIGDVPYALRNLSTLGFLELSTGDPEAALRFLDPIREELARLHYAEPSVIRYDANRIEALIQAGRLAEAEEHTAWLVERGDRLQRRSAIATAGRCRGLLAAARGNLDESLALFDWSILQHEGVLLPFDRARTLLAHGTVLRRTKQKRPARASLQSALKTFNDLGATLWSRRTQEELDRVGGPAAQQRLTPTESRVASLVASGRTNREVSQQLFISVKTVEANLSRIYAKLAVRSRSELAAQLAGLRAEASQP